MTNCVQLSSIIKLHLRQSAFERASWMRERMSLDYVNFHYGVTCVCVCVLERDIDKGMTLSR